MGWFCRDEAEIVSIKDFLVGEEWEVVWVCPSCQRVLDYRPHDDSISSDFCNKCGDSAPFVAMKRKVLWTERQTVMSDGMTRHNTTAKKMPPVDL